MSNSVEIAQPVLTWSVTVPISDAALDTPDVPYLEQHIASRMDYEVRKKLDEGYQLVSEGKIEIMRDVSVPTKFDAIDEEGEPYNYDESPVGYTLRSFVRKIVRLVPVTVLA